MLANTPCYVLFVCMIVFSCSIYLIGLVFEWILEQGGVEGRFAIGCGLFAS